MGVFIIRLNRVIKRKQYSCVALGETNPYTGEAIGVDPAYNAEFVGTDHNPNVYTLKYWREQHGAMKKRS